MAAVFLANGFAFGSWASRIPAIRDEFRLTADRLGLVLMAITVGALLALPASGLVVQRFGPRPTVQVAGLVVGLGVSLVGLSPGLSGAAAGFALFGMATGLWDVGMNVEAAEVERRTGREIMARFHAGWSLGSLGGAGLGALAARTDLPLRVHLPLAAALATTAALWAPRRFFPAPARDAATPGPASGSAAARGRWRPAGLRVWREPRTLAIGVLVLGLTLAEGAANDWFALGLVDDYGTGQAVGALGYAVFTAALLSARMAAPWLLGRFGRVTALRGSGLGAAAGIGLYLLGARLDGPAAGVLAVLAALFWGAGSALAFPVGLSAAADDPARAAARVSAVATIGYLAFLAGPPLIGRLAAEVGVANALGAIAVPVLLTLLVTAAARPLDPADAQDG